MLVLCRSTHETIHIGNDITLHLVRSSSGRAWIGIDAPPEIPISRGELGKPQERPDVKPTTPTI